MTRWQLLDLLPKCSNILTKKDVLQKPLFGLSDGPLLLKVKTFKNARGLCFFAFACLFSLQRTKLPCSVSHSFLLLKMNLLGFNRIKRLFVTQDEKRNFAIICCYLLRIENALFFTGSHPELLPPDFFIFYTSSNTTLPFRGTV